MIAGKDTYYLGEHTKTELSRRVSNPSIALSHIPIGKGTMGGMPRVGLEAG